MHSSRKAVARLVAGVMAAATLGMAGPVAPAQADADLEDYVVVRNEDGVVEVATRIPGQPLVSASVDTNTGEVCFGFSLQPFHCTEPIVTGITTSTAIPSPVWVDVDASDGFVGAGVQVGTGSIVAVGYYTNEQRACVSVGMADRICVPST